VWWWRVDSPASSNLNTLGETPVMKREGRNLLTELGRLNSDVVPFAMKVIE